MSKLFESKIVPGDRQPGLTRRPFRSGKRKKYPGLLLLAACCFCWGALSAHGQDTVTGPVPESKVDQMGRKCVRGITNIATGWGELLPRQFIRSAYQDEWYEIVPFGLARGVFMTVTRTMSGVIETVFFYVPFDGHYSPLMNPAYVWGPMEDRREAAPERQPDFR